MSVYNINVHNRVHDEELDFVHQSIGNLWKSICKLSDIVHIHNGDDGPITRTRTISAITR
uniref:Uncharacterized protein n=1 Tax=Glossina brevipalpis TaxID=37001 RepID=A0A1A9X2F5_9MUSC